jgi:hypothetical protein
MPSALLTTCPHCRKTLPAEERNLLKKVLCTHCRQSFTVQAIKPAPATDDTVPIPALQDTLEQPPPPEKGEAREAGAAKQTAPKQPTRVRPRNRRSKPWGGSS